MKKILVHIGTGKTGTTTIQRALRSAQRKKQLIGFTYPDFGGEAHHQIVLLCQSLERLPRGYAQIYSNDIELMKSDIDALKSKLELSSLNDENIVLSSEFFINFNHDEITSFKNLLDFYYSSPEVNICVYVRDPMTYYASFLQQKCKSSCELVDPSSFYYNFKNIIKLWKNVFNKEIFVRPFKREYLYSGCVAKDFDKLISSLFSIDQQTLDVKSDNKSFSLEALSALVEYRKLFCEDKNNITTSDSNMLIKIFSEKNLINNDTPLKLKCDVNKIIYDRHKEDIYWLKEKYGIDYTVKDIEYSEDINCLDISGNVKSFNALSDIFENYEGERNRKFLLGVINHLLISYGQK